jgi:hypothetical protein
MPASVNAKLTFWGMHDMSVPRDPTARDRWDHLRERVTRSTSATARALRSDYHCDEVLAANGPSEVQYWNDTDRRSHAAQIVDGRLHVGTDLVNESKSKGLCSRHWFSDKLRFGYVLGRGESGEKSLYLFKPQEGKTHHSSPMAGRPVIDVGMMTILNGQVAYIEHKSGHYKPNPEQVHHTLDYLENKGMNLSGVYYSCHVPRPSFDVTTISPAYFSNLVDAKVVAIHDASRLHETKSFESSLFEVPRGSDIEDVTRLLAPRELVPGHASPDPHGDAALMREPAQARARVISMER